MNSYLRGRSQSVVINGTKSKPADLPYGVPQGSVLRPILFTVYTSLIGAIAKRHNLEIHLYVDDTQIYIFFKTKDFKYQAEALRTIQECVSEIRQWMAENKLQLNDQKTEFLIICAPWKRDCVQFDEIEIGDTRISSTTDAKNLGVIMDKSLNMEKHIQKLCQTSMAQLRNIADVRKYLTQNAAEKLIHAFITSRLDYCNSLLYGLPSLSLKKLQKVQNMAAKILTLRRKYEHITPILQELHWLPVEHRITYKILLTTHRALNGKAPQYITDLLTPYIRLF